MGPWDVTAIKGEDSVSIVEGCVLLSGKRDLNLDIAYSVMLKCSHVVSRYYSRF